MVMVPGPILVMGPGPILVMGPGPLFVRHTTYLRHSRVGLLYKNPTTRIASDRYRSSILWQEWHPTAIRVVRGLNGVAVAQNGLILGEDGATWSGKVSGYLRGLPDTI